ncbi:MAG: hypothetical protein GX786_00150 [Clostridiales bacterium]|nr:hypothetical protein [Clostridiales bacterium]
MNKFQKQEAFTIKVPAHEQWQLAIRMGLSAAGALLGLSIDQVDDLRMVADEACDCLRYQGKKAETIKVCCYQKDAFVHVVFTATHEQETQNVAESNIEMVQAILETLTVETHLRQDQRGIWEIEIVLPLDIC